MSLSAFKRMKSGDQNTSEPGCSQGGPQSAAWAALRNTLELQTSEPTQTPDHSLLLTGPQGSSSSWGSKNQRSRRAVLEHHLKRQAAGATPEFLTAGAPELLTGWVWVSKSHSWRAHLEHPHHATKPASILRPTVGN